MKLHYRRYGKGLPIIIIHGLFGSSVNWNSIGKKLAGHDSVEFTLRNEGLNSGDITGTTISFEVYLIDLRNHGRSPHSDDFNFQLMSNDLGEFIDDHSINKAVIMGHSMGGKVAMNFVLQHPEKVHKLIVIDASPKYYHIGQWEVLDVLRTIDLSLFKSRYEVDKHLSLIVKDTASRQFLLQNLFWNSNGKLDWRCNMEVIIKEIDETGKAIENSGIFYQPALFIRGERSDFILNEDFALIKKNFPKAEIKTILGAGHWVHVDQPEALMECIVN
ncbi:MAG: alpha/beta fold hydrolase [Bacteroidota bacterium]